MIAYLYTLEILSSCFDNQGKHARKRTVFFCMNNWNISRVLCEMVVVYISHFTYTGSRLLFEPLYVAPPKFLMKQTAAFPRSVSNLWSCQTLLQGEEACPRMASAVPSRTNTQFWYCNRLAVPTPPGSSLFLSSRTQSVFPASHFLPSGQFLSLL